MRKVILAAVMFLCSAAFAGVEEYKRAVELDGNSVINRYNLGYAYYNEGKYDDAVDSLKRALEMRREDTEAHAKVDAAAAQILGIVFYNFKNNDDEAIKYFKKTSELKPGDGDNYYYMGLAYLRKGDQKSADECFSTALAKGTENTAEANFRLGQIRFRNNLFAEAVTFLESAVAAKPKSETALDAREILGIIYHKRENTDKAVENLLAVVKARPQNFNAHYLLGLNYFKQKKYDKMISAYKKAIEINPQFADAHYNLGMAYYYRNEFMEAIKEFEAAKSLNPNDAATFSILAQTKSAAYEYHLSRGSIALTEEKYLDAKKELEAALSVKPGDSEAAKYMEKAVQALRSAVPERLKAASAHYAAGKYAEAYNDWDFVLQADPGNSEAREGLTRIESNLSGLIEGKEKAANSLAAAGNYTAALTEYREILGMVPKEKKKSVGMKIEGIKARQKAKVAEILASAEKLAEKKNLKAALAKYNEALRYDRENTDALDGITRMNAKMEADKERYMAMARQNSSNAEKAADYYRKVLAIDPTNQEANAGIEKLTGKKSQAAIDARQIKELYYQGVDRYVNGEIEEAIRIWKKVMAIDPGNLDAQKNIRRAQEKLAAIKNLGR